MFERFTERARKVIVSAQGEAERLQHCYLGTEHLLLGLLREEEGIAGQVLYSAGATLDEAREQVESIVGYGEEGTGGQAPFTPRSKKVLELALREALQLGHNYIGTEHLLLGLLCESEGLAARVLSNLDVDSDAVHRKTLLWIRRGQPGIDPPDESERRVEGREHQTLFQGRVVGIQVTVEPLGALHVDVDYSYWLVEDPAIALATLDPEDIASVTRTHLDEMSIDTLERATKVTGRHLMDTFADVLEVTVSVTLKPEPADSKPRAFCMSATFRR